MKKIVKDHEEKVDTGEVAKTDAGKPASKDGRPPDEENYYFDETTGKWTKKYKKNGKLRNGFYLHELNKLQEELVKLQYWVKETGQRGVIVFEGSNIQDSKLQ